MAHPVAGGGVGPNGGKDVAHVAKLALLGLGTLATGAFGLVSLAAGYKVSRSAEQQLQGRRCCHALAIKWRDEDSYSWQRQHPTVTAAG